MSSPEIALPSRTPVERFIRFSEIRTFKWCRRTWMNGYALGWTLPEFDGETKPTKANTGTLVHADLEAYWRGDTTRPGKFHRLRPPPHSEAFAKEWADVWSLAQIMLDGYAQWLEEEGMEQGEETLFVEKELILPMGTIGGDKVNVVMHIDRIVRDTDFDRIIVEDTKTVDQMGKDASFAVEEQLLTYALGVQEVLGLPVAECRHNMLRRVKRTARATPPFYGRESIVPNGTQLDNHRRQLLGVLHDMVSAYQALEEGDDHQYVAYPNPGRDCSWRCKFMPICVNHDDGSDLDALRASIYIQTKKEPEA